MFCSFFKKIGLCISLLFSSFGSMFHHHKPVKPITTLTEEQINNSEFIIKDEAPKEEPSAQEVIQDVIEEVVEVAETIEVIDIPVIVEKTVKEKIKELEVTLDELYREKARLDKDKKKAKRALKEKRIKEEFERRNEDSKEIMNKIDIIIARTPKEMPRYNKWHLTDKEMDSVDSNKKNVTVITEDEPNNIFV